ncbi:TetR/AcrR family transcriptional regulator [Paenibacillus glufosinatiresistens]|uniref:TetR/AcrR family transcriptional regulator n=1 Tax=Paenibacillus glufosinatiresistens TaxID=3070657 RepID=UPI00286E8271|nr:TetR family transcriptional regulator C-terminal domain-containing protein [Paenibacillus sp. YX.27]
MCYNEHMPKIVNHEQKKEYIAAAAWRVILREGMKGATVRGIAQEAGMSLGALRHYFSTQEDLIAYAMQLVRERALLRITANDRPDLPPKTRVLNLLFEVVPWSEDTRAEMDVWLAYVFSLGPKADTLGVQQEMRTGMQSLIAYLSEVRMLREGTDPELAAETLYSLVDGLAMHAYLEPGRLSKERIAAVLTGYLDSICVAEQGG